MSNNNNYEYDKLTYPAHEVLVAIIEPGAFDDAIVVRFISRNLQVCTTYVAD